MARADGATDQRSAPTTCGNIEGGRITGADVTVNAKTDLEVIGASIDASNKLDVRGDRDLFLKVEG